MMRDELFIKCLENSLWAQYIIEFFKFVGFAVSKETYADCAKEKEEKSKKIFLETKDFNSNQLNIVISNAVCSLQNGETDTSREIMQKTDCVTLIHDDNSLFEVVIISYFKERDDIEIEKKGIINDNIISIINICVDETEFRHAEIRERIIKGLLNELNDIEQDRDILWELYSEYERYGVFFHLYNEGLIKYTEDYYNGSGKSNGFIDEIKKACESSKTDLTKCFDELSCKLKTEANQYKDNKNVRYAVLLLKYKINDLNNTIEQKDTFWSRKMLAEIDAIIKKYPLFIRAYYLAAMICRSDYHFNHLFIYYIDKALQAVAEGDYSGETKSFLYYQLGKYYEGHDYSIDIIKKAYEQSVKVDSSNCFAQYKIAEYAYQTGKKEEVEKSIVTLKKLEESLVDHFDEEKLMPKRRILGFRCCVFLGNIEYNLQHYDKAKYYYEKAIKLAIKQSKYFEYENNNNENNNEDNWNHIFFMCLPLTPVTRNLIHIYGSEQETSNEVEKLRRIFFKEKLETELKEYWKNRLT